MPDCKDLLKSNVNGVTSSSFASFNMRGKIVSGPGDLIILSLSIHFNTPLSVTVILYKTSLLLIKTSGIVGMLFRSSAINTEAKKELRMRCNKLAHHGWCNLRFR